MKKQKCLVFLCSLCLLWFETKSLTDFLLHQDVNVSSWIFCRHVQYKNSASNYLSGTTYIFLCKKCCTHIIQVLLLNIDCGKCYLINGLFNRLDNNSRCSFSLWYPKWSYLSFLCHTAIQKIHFGTPHSLTIINWQRKMDLFSSFS